MSSLENLVKVTPSEKFKHFDNHFKTDIEQKLLKQKGVYPYDYMNGYDRFDETSFPSQKDCYSQLNKESISDTSVPHTAKHTYNPIPSQKTQKNLDLRLVSGCRDRIPR